MRNIILKTGLLAIVFTCALNFAPTAKAAGPLANCKPGIPFVWPNGGTGIPFSPDLGDLGPLTNAEAVALTQSAFDVWAAESDSVSYLNAGSLAIDIDETNFFPVYEGLQDGISPIVFDKDGAIFDLLFGPGSGILGFAGPEFGDFDTCEISEGGAFLNGGAFGDLDAAFDVMVHEFGHYTNLAHTVVNGAIADRGDTSGPSPDDPFPIDNFNNGSLGIPTLICGDLVETMYPFYFGPTSFYVNEGACDGTSAGGTQTLQADDIASLNALYPDSGYDVSTMSFTGTVYRSDALTGVAGVNVIARNEVDPHADAVTAISGDYFEEPDNGSFTIHGLTPGADYRLYVDELLAGGFSTTPATPFPGPEEYHNAGESNNITSPDVVNNFTPVNPGDSDVDVIFNVRAPGDPLPVGDDGFVQLTLPFDYEFCGQTFDSIFVHANGFVTFGSPDTDFFNWLEDGGTFLSQQPRIAMLWDDLSPFNLDTGVQQGLVTYDQSRNWIKVIFEDVPEYANTGSNSFTMTLKRSSNHIDVDYGEVSAADGLVGVSCGGAITSGSELAEDVGGSNGRINLHNAPARFEVFDVANPLDLANSSVEFNGTTDYNDSWAGNNNSPLDARSLNLPFSSADAVRFTEIDPETDEDWYRFDTSGLASFSAEIVSSQLDTLMVLIDSGGNLVAFDDDGGAGLLSAISIANLPAGTYFLGVATFDGASTGRYVLEIEESDAVTLSLGDDDSAEVSLGFDFPFNGGLYSSVFVNSNGNLTFGSGNTDFSSSVSELLSDQPRIAPLWDDLSPNNAGSVSVEFGAGEATVIFDSVPEFFVTGANSFMVTLRVDGSFTIQYGAVSSTDALVGTTEGGGAADPGASDLTTGGLSASGTTYESGPTDLSGTTLDFNP